VINGAPAIQTREIFVNPSIILVRGLSARIACKMRDALAPIIDVARRNAGRFTMTEIPWGIRPEAISFSIAGIASVACIARKLRGAGVAVDDTLAVHPSQPLPWQGKASKVASVLPVCINNQLTKSRPKAFASSWLALRQRASGWATAGRAKRRCRVVP
jgi:hypothetical protein